MTVPPEMSIQDTWNLTTGREGRWRHVNVNVRFLITHFTRIKSQSSIRFYHEFEKFKTVTKNRILDDNLYDFVGSTRWVAEIHLEVTMGNDGEGKMQLYNKIETWVILFARRPRTSYSVITSVDTIQPEVPNNIQD